MTYPELGGSGGADGKSTSRLIRRRRPPGQIPPIGPTLLHDDLPMAPFHGPLVFGEFVDGAIGADLADNVIAVGVSARGGEDEWVGGEGAAEGVEGLAGGDYEGRFLLQVE
mmetsp:Transcript_18843/g.28695  ORF Transcript_18843/g.28695 Transcript_18843/m.28695 type:complete len:111 (-) Transcript_18843:435-767(-)